MKLNWKKIWENYQNWQDSCDNPCESEGRAIIQKLVEEELRKAGSVK